MRLAGALAECPLVSRQEQIPLLCFHQALARRSCSGFAAELREWICRLIAGLSRSSATPQFIHAPLRCISINVDYVKDLLSLRFGKGLPASENFIAANF